MIVFSRAMSPMRRCPFQPLPRSIGRRATCRTSWLHLEGLTHPLPLLSSWYCNQRLMTDVHVHLLSHKSFVILVICVSSVALSRFFNCNSCFYRQPMILKWLCETYLVQTGCKCVPKNKFELICQIVEFVEIANVFKCLSSLNSVSW